MATNFPASLDSLTNPTSSDSLNSPSHSAQHANANDAIEALQAKVGVDSSAVATSLDYKVAQLEARAGTNLLYNGAMQVAQRGTSVTGITTAAGYYTADRWYMGLSGLGTWTQTVENDAPAGSGFSKSLKLLCTTADAAPAGSDYLVLDQRLEGQDLQRVAKGSASAQQLTLSFWVKSNVTGTYIAELVDIDNIRAVSASYSVNASATWEKKTITFPADTTGVFDNDNALSLLARWWLGAGTDYTSGTLATSWVSTTNTDRAVGQTNLAAATSNYWQITGVQLELGDKATLFEHRSYGEELALCQRYYQRITAGGHYGRVAVGQAYTTSSVMAMMPLRQSLRTLPTAIDAAALHIVDGASAGFVIYTFSLDTAGSNQDVVAVTATTAGLTNYRPYQISGYNNPNGYLAVSAEL